MKGGKIDMKRIDGILYYSLRETAYLLKVSKQTVFNWVEIDRQMKEEGKEGFLPNPTMIGKKYFFTNGNIKEIKDGISKVKRGDFLPYRKKETAYQKMKKENEELKKKLAELGGETK